MGRSRGSGLMNKMTAPWWKCFEPTEAFFRFPTVERGKTVCSETALGQEGAILSTRVCQRLSINGFGNFDGQLMGIHCIFSTENACINILDWRIWLIHFSSHSHSKWTLLFSRLLHSIP